MVISNNVLFKIITSLPVGENYSESITKSGTYEIHVEIFDEKYSKSITTTKTLEVK